MALPFEPAPEAHRVGPETTHLRLRAFTPEDAAVFRRLRSDPAIVRYTGDGSSASLEACRDALAAYPDFRLYGFGRWAAVDRGTGEVVGMAGLMYLPDWGLVDLGYRFVPEVWGRGLATEASRACVDFGLNTLGLEAVHAFVDPANLASRRVAEKVGMTVREEVLYDAVPALRYTVDRLPSAPPTRPR